MVDGGDLFWKRGVLPEAERPQALVKADLQVEALLLAGLDAFVPGEGDFALGTDATLERLAKLPTLAAGLSCGDTSFEAVRVVEREGVSVAVLGVTDVAPEGCTAAEDPEAAAAAALQGVEADVTVVVVHGPIPLGNAVAGLPGVDFVVQAHGGQKWSSAKPGDSAWLLAAGSRGKTLGVARLGLRGGAGWVDEGRAEDLGDRIERYRDRLTKAQDQVRSATDDKAAARAERQAGFYERKLAELEAERDAAAAVDLGNGNTFRLELTDLSRKVEDHPGVKALVDAALPRIASAEAAPVEAYEGPFVGSAACVGCHLEQHAQWTGTGHARAYAALDAEGRAEDRACFSCHVTGAHHDAGPQSPVGVPAQLRGVGCESCHGPGGEHVAAPAAGQMAQPSLDTCTTCHDGEQDEGRFEPDAYLERVRH